MGTIRFCRLDKANAVQVFPELFQILHTNMSRIALSPNSYEEDEAMWLSYVLPQTQQENLQFLLMYVGNILAGYFQYSVNGDILMVDEVEIKPEYQRTRLFYQLCIYLCNQLSPDIRFVESYVNKQNENSLRIHQKLGIEVIGESKSGSSWRMRGEVRNIRAYFERKRRDGYDLPFKAN